MDHYNNNNFTDFDDTPLRIEFQEERMGQHVSTKPVQQDTQLTAFVNQALHISCDAVSSFEDSSYEMLQESLSSFHEICEDEEFVPETTFNDSMSSLDAAYEKLNACMERTAQSRKLIRMSQKQPSVTLSREDSQRSLSRLGSQSGGRFKEDSQRSVTHLVGPRGRGLLNRQDSNKSPSSLGTTSVRRSSKTSVLKARGSFKLRQIFGPHLRPHPRRPRS
jgi:hypothetical protein